MKEEIEELFNAPWCVKNYLHIVDKNDNPVGVTSNMFTSKRISYLPELYDALIDATYKTCHDCIYVTLKQDNVPLPNELIEKGCPMKFECSVKKAWEVLKKVKEGK